MRKTTLRDLANILNLSISTISKALNNNSEISIERRKQIQSLAKAMNYRPNNVAKSLKSKKTYQIGVIIPNITEDFFTMLFEGIEKEASKKGYKLIPCISNDSQEKENKALNDFSNGSVDGIMISLSRATQKNKDYNNLMRLKEMDIPMVMFDRTCNDVSCDKVIIDDEMGGYKATKHLIKAGCKRILFLSTISNTNVSNLRCQGFKSAIDEFLSTPRPLPILRLGGYEGFQKHLMNSVTSNKIDGIVAADERSAIHAMNILRNFGYSIPNDISIIGFTNGNLSKYSYPSLTTIDQHATKIGSNSAKLLINRIEKFYIGVPICEVIKSTLIHRNSTKSAFVVA